MFQQGNTVQRSTGFYSLRLSRANRHRADNSFLGHGWYRHPLAQSIPVLYSEERGSLARATNDDHCFKDPRDRRCIQFPLEIAAFCPSGGIYPLRGLSYSANGMENITERCCNISEAFFSVLLICIQGSCRVTVFPNRTVSCPLAHDIVGRLRQLKILSTGAARPIAGTSSAYAVKRC